jgi:hypothetical protein
VADALNQFFKSTSFQLIWDSFSQFSGFLSERQDGAERAPRQLPAGHSVLRDGAVHPVLGDRSPLHFLIGLFKLAATLRHLDVGLLPFPDAVSGLLKTSYLTRMLGSTPALASNWFSRFEARLLFWVLSLWFPEPRLQSGETVGLAVRVCGLLQSADQLLLQQLLDKAVFSAGALGTETLNKRLSDQLWLDAPLLPSSAAAVGNSGTAGAPQVGKILADSLDDIKLIKETYLGRLLSPEAVEFSHALHSLIPGGTSTLCVKPGPILPQDWAYLPLLEAYNRAQVGPATSAQQMSRVCDAALSKDIQNCLAWLLLCETGARRAEVATARYYRLSTVFLCSSDLFLDPMVHSLLAAHMRTMMGGPHRPDLSLTVPGLSSGHEFYLQLLDQFQAVSYGDQLFAIYLVLPLSMKQPVAFRRCEF